jgi:hypothetical protein
MRPPPGERRIMSPDEKMARLESDQLGDIQAGRAPRAPPDPDAPARVPARRFGPLALPLLQLLQRAAAPLTVTELSAYLGVPPPHVTGTLRALVLSRRVLALQGDARGMRFWLRGRLPRR